MPAKWQALDLSWIYKCEKRQYSPSRLLEFSGAKSHTQTEHITIPEQLLWKRLTYESPEQGTQSILEGLWGLGWVWGIKKRNCGRDDAWKSFQTKGKHHQRQRGKYINSMWGNSRCTALECKVGIRKQWKWSIGALLEFANVLYIQGKNESDQYMWYKLFCKTYKQNKQK